MPSQVPFLIRCEIKVAIQTLETSNLMTYLLGESTCNEILHPTLRSRFGASHHFYDPLDFDILRTFATNGSGPRYIVQMFVHS